MKRAYYSKMTALAMMLAMLFNPLMGLAGQSLNEQAPATVAPQLMQQAGDMPDVHEEHCHDHMPELKADSPLTPNLHHTPDMQNDCCESLCMCGQAGCQAPLAVLESSETPFSAVSTTFHSVLSRYISPTLSSLNPPPII